MAFKTDVPRISIAGRVDPKDLAICAVHLLENGATVENKSDLVFYAFRWLSEFALLQDEKYSKEGYYEGYFDILEKIGIEFVSPRDKHDRIKALLRDSIEEFSDEDQDQILELMQDLRRKAKTKAGRSEPLVEGEQTVSLEDALSSLAEDESEDE